MKKRLTVFGVKTFPSQGGTDRVAENITYQLRDKYDITLYCFKNDAPQSRFDGLRVVEFKRILPGAPGVFLYFFQSTLHLLFTGKADVVHAHKTETAFFIPLLRIRFKVVATSHEAQYKSDKWGWFARRYFYLVEWLFIKSANVCTTISQPLAAFYEQKHNRKVHFVANGINLVDPAQFDFNHLQQFIPKGASLDRPFILFSARRLLSIKGGHTMLLALKEVGYSGQVFITGELDQETPYLQEIRQLADGLNVFFLGFVSPLNTLLALVAKCDLFIFPSETEGMSIMLLEVASVGKPIIASDIPENKQVFGDEDVLYFKSKSVPDLANKIKFALLNKSLMAGYGQRCQHRVTQDYQWGAIAQAYDRIYAEVISGK